MDRLLPLIRIKVHPGLYLKDPESSELGKRILSSSVGVIHTMGMERFTFKKLSNELQTTESSIYRYFENKHKLLLYLSSWYWAWLETYIVFQTANRIDPLDKFKIMLEILGKNNWNQEVSGSVDMNILRQIMITESSKAFLTKEVEAENKEGLFEGFKQLCHRFCVVFKEINPNYPYPEMLSTTIVEGVFHQQFFKSYFPALTDSSALKDDTAINDFFYFMAIAMLSNNNKV